MVQRVNDFIRNDDFSVIYSTRSQFISNATVSEIEEKRKCGQYDKPGVLQRALCLAELPVNMR